MAIGFGSPEGSHERGAAQFRPHAVDRNEPGARARDETCPEKIRTGSGRGGTSEFRMGLSQSERAAIERVRSVGSAELAVELDDEVCGYLAALIAADLGLAKHFPDLPKPLPSFFETQPPDSLRLRKTAFWGLIERLVELDRNASTYFFCLAALHKARLKYARILRNQPLPTMDQVGPRGLLQYGAMTPKALTGFLLWRKWLFDIDNRAAQETGYLFEPIIPHAIGGVPANAKNSPIRRHRDPEKGRQVDCLRQKLAYELKLRVTIAASGQGRWREELDFPIDCRRSGFKPILLVFDPTPNPKLRELEAAFRKEKGEAYVGAAAWRHLDEAAGPTMARFIEKYVRQPIDALLREVPEKGLPRLTLTMEERRLGITVGRESVEVTRAPTKNEAGDEDELPEDVDDTIPGP